MVTFSRYRRNRCLFYYLVEIYKNYKYFVEVVENVGGHYSSPLGVVDLTIALHYIYNSPLDKNMTNFIRKNLLDSSAPNPSVETLLHAYLPHKYVDHTHSTSILSIVNQKDSNNLCKK